MSPIPTNQTVSYESLSLHAATAVLQDISKQTISSIPLCIQTPDNKKRVITWLIRKNEYFIVDALEQEHISNQ